MDEKLKRALLVISTTIFLISPHFAQAKTFFASKPNSADVISAILAASAKTSVRPAMLHGLFGQETAYGGNLGKTENGWSGFCATRNTENCFNWRNYDCKTDYRNARHFDEILISLGFTNISGSADRSSIPVSSTCAMGFTQFEPNTWWGLGQSRELGSRVPSPWDVNDSILMAAYYLEDLGADKREILKSSEVIGEKDRIALQRYYCGGNYTRRECQVYAAGVEAKARLAPVALLQTNLSDQLNYLIELQNDLRRRLNLKQVTSQPIKVIEAPTTPASQPKPQTPAEKIPEPPESPLVITSPKELAGATQSFFYEMRLSAAGGIPYYRWSIVSGSLPSGLRFNSSDTDGYISGHHESTGSYEFMVRVTDYSGKTAEKNFRLTVYSSPVIPEDYGARILKGVVGEQFSFKLPVSGGVAPYIWTIFENFPENESPPDRVWSTFGGPPDKELTIAERSSRSSSYLPAGLKLDSASGVISGEPTESNAMGFSAMVTDSRGLNYNMSFYVTISLPTKPITNDESADNYPIVFGRQSGGLIAFYKTYNFTTCLPAGNPCEDHLDRLAGVYSSVSADDGKIWSAPRLMVMNDGEPLRDYADITEDANDELILIAKGGEVFTLTSKDGRVWTNERPVTSVAINDNISSIIYASDGYYYVGYDSFSNVRDDNFHVFVTRSKDLITWENPVQISSGSGSEFSPGLFQASSGEIYAAYSAIPKKEITIAELLDGKSWAVTGRIETDPVFIGMGLNFVEIDSKPILLFYGGVGGTSYYSFLANGVWSKPAKFYLEASYKIDGVVLNDGSLGLAHIYYTDYYRDIYFANIAKLKF